MPRNNNLRESNGETRELYAAHSLTDRFNVLSEDPGVSPADHSVMGSPLAPTIWAHLMATMLATVCLPKCSSAVPCDSVMQISMCRPKLH